MIGESYAEGVIGDDGFYHLRDFLADKFQVALPGPGKQVRKRAGDGENLKRKLAAPAGPAEKKMKKKSAKNNYDGGDDKANGTDGVLVRADGAFAVEGPCPGMTEPPDMGMWSEAELFLS